jgi:hypothetical protein
MLESLATFIFVWVSRYIASFCLVSIALWGAGMYLWGKEWHIKVRDAGIFLATIGLLTVILAFKPAKTDAIFWPPVTWFCFSMLTVLELLWLAFLVESIFRAFGKMTKSESEKPPRPRLNSPNY